VPVDDVVGELSLQLTAAPEAVALFVDFDGTLAPIVSEPGEARPLPAAVTALTSLAERCAVVAVVSGRPLQFLEPWFPPTIQLAGLYGLEQRVGGARLRDREAESWRELVSETARLAIAELPADVLVEDKGLSLTVHYRTSPHRAGIVRLWVEHEARATGLQARPAKMSMELHPPVHRDKGQVINEWGRDARSVLFAGDDAGDLPGFAALDVLADAGAATWRVVVAGSETPDAVLAAADLAVDSPGALADLLAQLAAAAAAT
jgi:trehalose 6-phosphate phosphatase